MQRMICRYRRDASVNALSHADLRSIFFDAAKMAGLPIGDDRRAIIMGPPLPPGATSEAERVVLELTEPQIRPMFACD